jgi:hypothetical protein
MSRAGGVGRLPQAAWEYTTRAMKEGAIDGAAVDYEVAPLRSARHVCGTQYEQNDSARNIVFSMVDFMLTYT